LDIEEDERIRYFFFYYLQAWMGRVGVIFSSFYFVSSQGDTDDIKNILRKYKYVQPYFDVEKIRE
jgi:hypothetical protein